MNLKNRNTRRFVFVLCVALCLTIGIFGWFTPHTRIGLVLMACSGYLAWVGVYIMDPPRFFNKSPDNESLRNENAKTVNRRKIFALLFNFVLIFGLCLTFGINGWNTPHTRIGLGLMFCAGMLVGYCLFILGALWDLIKSPGKELYSS